MKYFEYQCCSKNFVEQYTSILVLPKRALNNFQIFWLFSYTLIKFKIFIINKNIDLIENNRNKFNNHA